MNLAQTIDLYAGGPGSGCDPDVAQSHGEKCGRPSGTGEGTGNAKSGDLAQFKALKNQWASLNNDLLEHLDNPNSTEARALMESMRDVSKKINNLNLDTGALEDIGLPGGPKDILVVGAGPGGLATSVMGATDGLDTMFVDSNTIVGGQAKFSSRIENYTGFPI